MSAEDVPALVFDISRDAFAEQVREWQDIRGRVAALVAIAPAVALVVVATTNPEFDALTVCSGFVFILAIWYAVLALFRKGKDFAPGISLTKDPPPGTHLASLQLALAQELRETQRKNAELLDEVEALFRNSATSFLIAVSLWMLHVIAS
jgi:hypothetical protein